MNQNDIARKRFLNQQFLATKFTTTEDLVSWFGAVQAQEYTLSKWGLGLRLTNLVDADIEKEFVDGKILRTHVLRPTWHFVTPTDIRWLLTLTAPRVNAINSFMHRKLGLEDKFFNQCNEIIVEILQDNKQLTRDEINQYFQQNQIQAQGLTLSYIMMQAEMEGIICSGAKKGNQFTYALLEERVPKVDPKSYDEALFEITKKYFSSRGPASLKDFSTWSGLTLSSCKIGIEMNKSLLHVEVIDGLEYYFVNDFSPKSEPIPGLFLLPVYDEYMMGYRDRDAMFQLKNSLNTKPVLDIDSFVVYDGQVIGTWKRTIKSQAIEAVFDFFESLTEQQSPDFKEAIIRLEQFYGKPCYVQCQIN